MPFDPLEVAAARYQRATGEPLPADRFAFGASPELADELAALVVAGTKRATTSLLADHTAASDPLPAPGDRSVVLDGAGTPVCVIETTSVDIRRFEEVDTRFAFDEGEGDRSLAWWRTEHEQVFRARCHELGVTFSPKLEVVCERFHVIWQPQPRPGGPDPHPGE
jgi:uncharacterized protein YhfF